jgi:hypothetical protein
MINKLFIQTTIKGDKNGLIQSMKNRRNTMQNIENVGDLIKNIEAVNMSYDTKIAQQIINGTIQRFQENPDYHLDDIEIYLQREDPGKSFYMADSSYKGVPLRFWTALDPEELWNPLWDETQQRISSLCTSERSSLNSEDFLIDNYGYNFYRARNGYFGLKGYVIVRHNLKTQLSTFVLITNNDAQSLLRINKSEYKNLSELGLSLKNTFDQYF